MSTTPERIEQLSFGGLGGQNIGYSRTCRSSGIDSRYHICSNRELGTRDLALAPQGALCVCLPDHGRQDHQSHGDTVTDASNIWLTPKLIDS